jgi:hypothetical protein
VEPGSRQNLISANSNLPGIFRTRQWKLLPEGDIFSALMKTIHFPQAVVFIELNFPSKNWPEDCFKEREIKPRRR